MSIFKLRLMDLKYVRFLCTKQLCTSKRKSQPCMKQQEHLIINQSLHENHNINNEMWIEIRKELLDSKLHINKNNIDVAIMNRCMDSVNVTAALSYVKFLKAANFEVNLATAEKYFRLLYKERKSLSVEEEEFVFTLYDAIRTKYSIFDGKTAESCMMVLSMTKRWKECFNLLEMVEFGGYPKFQSYRILATAAFDNNDGNTAWEYMHSIQQNLHFNDRLTESYINFCNRNASNGKEMQALINQMFEFWSDYDIYPETKIIDMYANFLQNTGEWQVKNATISPRDGKCSECGHQLSDVHITQNDFEKLSKTFLTKVLVGEDVYNNTTPEELQNFKNFVNATKPYDVVIDGLNVGYTSFNHGDKQNHGAALADIVAAFVKQNKKIFILGRMHMKRWSAPDMNYVKKNSHLFFIKNASLDDPFLLYAAFSSGMNTLFSSRDFMRQHKFSLSDYYLRRIFRHWQLTRQVIPRYIGIPHNRQLLLVYPPKFIFTSQKNLNSDWHIPYDEKWQRKELQPSHYINLWKCFRKVNVRYQNDISIKSMEG